MSRSSVVSTPTNTDEFNGELPLMEFARIFKKLKPHIEKSPIPALNCVTLEFIGKACSVAYHGIDISIIKTIDTDFTGSGKIVIPASRLDAFLSAATGSAFTINKAKDAGSALLKADRLTASIITIHSADLPEIMPQRAAVGTVRGFDFGEGVLSHMLDFVAPCISTEETRYYLNGVCFEILDGEVLAVATDGHRLSTRSFKTPAPLAEWDRRPIVPHTAIRVARKLSGGTEGRVEFLQKNSEADVIFVLKAGGWTVISRTIDGTFPEWRRVCPEGATTFLEVKAVDINRFAAVSRAGAVSPFQRTALAVDNDDDGVSFTYRVANDTDEFRAVIDAKMTGEPLQRFGVNIGYLAGMASIFKGRTLKLHLIDPGSPIRITSPDSPESEFAILMPMRVDHAGKSFNHPSK